MNRKERTILVTILVNGFLIAFKFFLAGASGSLALRASAIHSVTDVAIGMFVLIGLFISRREKARDSSGSEISAVENWVALLVAVAIFYVAFDIVRDVLLAEPPELRNLGPITLAALVTVAVAYFLARYKLYVGRQTKSPALIASAYHSRMDIYASIVVVAGLAGGAVGLPNLDRTAAAIVVVFILFAGFEIGSSAIRALRQRQRLELEDSGHSQEGTAALGGMWRAFLPAAITLLVGLYLVSGFYTVQPGEAAVVRRFGRVTASNVGPGLHYRLPTPIDRVDVIAVDAVRRAESSPSLMLTGDENLISIQLSIHYTVSDPAAFLLRATDPETLVMAAGEAGMRQVVAQEQVDALLTVDRAEIQLRAAALAQSALDGYDAGLQIIDVQLLGADPPPEVAEAFRDVASAREDRNTFVNEAQGYRNEILPGARGQAEVTVQGAQAYWFEKIGLATGEAANFASQQGAYAEATEVTRLRLYLEALERILPGARKFVIDESIRLETTDLWIPGTSNVQTFPLQP